MTHEHRNRASINRFRGPDGYGNGNEGGWMWWLEWCRTGDPYFWKRYEKRPGGGRRLNKDYIPSKGRCKQL